MSEEPEYEPEPEYEEPESPERRIIDHFFEELGERKRSGAAEALRALHSAGGSLCRPDVELLADLLDGSADLSDVFPYRLEFAGRGPGRPRHSLQNQLQAPWIAFANGDEFESAKTLRQRNSLGGTDLLVLAGLLDDDPALNALFPWRLVLHARKKRGKPKTLRTRARQFTTALIFEEARSRAKQVKGAIYEVCDRTKLNRSTFYKARKSIDKSRIK
jgi:hypothetical protein